MKNKKAKIQNKHMNEKREHSNKREFQEKYLKAQDENIVIGRNPVKEVLNSGGTIEKVLILKDGEGSIKQLARKAKEKDIQIMYCDKKMLDRVSGGENHQGIIAYITDFEYSELEDILNYADSMGEKPFVILLDGITDPHNLGAIIRTAECAGVHGIIIPKRRAALVNATVMKTSAGATSYMRVAKVTNIANTIEELKDKGLWIYSCNMNGENFKSLKYDGGVGLVIGSEGSGVSLGVQNKCDFTVSIPMKGKINSLNASNAAAIVMYEIASQRDM